MPTKPTERCRPCEVVTLTDAELCARVQAGDRHAEGEIVLRYQPLVRRLVARSSCPPQVDHNDLVQVGLLSVLKAGRKFDPTLGVKFITVVWRYATRDIAKAKDREIRVTMGHFQERGDDHDGLEDSVAGIAQRPETVLPDGLAISLAQLRPLAREVVMLAFGFGGSPMGVVEIGRRLEIPTRDADAILTQAFISLGADPSRVVALPTSRPTSVRRRRAKAECHSHLTLDKLSSPVVATK